MIMAAHTGVFVRANNNDQPNAGSKEPAAQRCAPRSVEHEKGSGNGSASALSKLKLIERKKNEWQQAERSLRE